MIKRNKKGQFAKGGINGPRPEKVKKAISLANSGKGNGMWRGGKPKCKVCSKEICYGAEYCRSHLPRPWLSSEEAIKKSAKWRKENWKDEKKHPRWKGNEAGYGSIHHWIRKHLGAADHCAHCRKTEKRRYEWANKNGSLSRKLDDYIPLCVPCHRKFDDVGNKVWAKRRLNYGK